MTGCGWGSGYRLRHQRRKGYFSCYNKITQTLVHELKVNVTAMIQEEHI